jgi:hypothetical protein
MTPEEAAKFNKAGVKFMIIPFTIIIIFAVSIVFSTVQKSSDRQKLADGVQNNIAIKNICHKDLQQCGSGCIPSNAVCCDKTNGNSYCLWPDTLCKTNPATNGEKERFVCSNDEKVKSYDCPTGQIFCGMFCIDAGKKCCLGGVCDENKIETTNQSSDSKKNTNEQFVYSGELTINANFEKDYSVTRGLIHSSGQFATSIKFSNLTMSSFMLNTDGTPQSSGSTKVTGTYTSSCVNSGVKTEQNSVGGEIEDAYGKDWYGNLSFVEVFDNSVNPSRRLGFMPKLNSNLIPYRYREWCSLQPVSSNYIDTLVRDIFNGEYGNNQRIANMSIQKTGYINDDGETIQFSGTLTDKSISNFGLEGTTYTGTFRVYRE